MKGEYVEDDENEKNTSSRTNPHHNMFAKFSHHQQHHHQQQQQQQHPPKFQPHLHHPQHQHLQHQQHFPPPHLTHPFSEEADSPTPPLHLLQPHHSSPPPPSKKPKTTPPSATTTTTSNEDHCGTIEVSRRPRGRPPGSKNKPKPPIVITREPEPAMSPYILELPSGSDVIDSLTRFTRRRGVGLCVLTASGAVANVTLKQPSTTTPGGTVTFHGRFDILSLSAVVVGGNNNNNTTPFAGCGGFTISLAGPQGQIVGGKVVGTLVCSGTVYVIAASFNNPNYCRLPLDDHDNNLQQLHQHDNNATTTTTSTNPDNNNNNDQGNSPVSGGGTMSLYSGHLGGGAAPVTTAAGGGGGEVIWATPPQSGRQPY